MALERSTHEAEYYHLHKGLGLARLHPGWAKAEILIGLAAVSGGQLLGVYAIIHYRPTVLHGLFLAASILLQTLGGYLALAGHRSHLYQSQNKLTAWLAARISNG